MAPTAVERVGSHWLSTLSGKSSAIPGTMSHHTVSDPKVMMAA